MRKRPLSARGIRQVIPAIRNPLARRLIEGAMRLDKLSNQGKRPDVGEDPRVADGCPPGAQHHETVRPRLPCAGGLLGRRVRLKNTKRVSFGVEKIPLPADACNGEFGQCDSPTAIGYLLCDRVEIRDFH